MTAGEQRFLIAKYTPDLRRNETRNIGVILWAGGNVASRFLPLSQAAAFVNESESYSRWIDYWNALLNKEEISIRGRKPVARDDSSYLDEVLRTQSGNYILEEAGAVIDIVKSSKINQAANYLYSELVDQRNSSLRITPKEQAKAIRTVVKELLADIGISKRSGLQEGYNVTCMVKDRNVQRSLRFTFAIMDKMRSGKPKAAIQGVCLNSPLSVDHAALMFDLLQKNDILKKEQCLIAIDKDDENVPDDASEQEKFLLAYGSIVNVREREAATQAFSSAANTA